MNELDAAGDRGRIAIVDDDEAFGDSLVAMLRSAGICCIAFSDVDGLIRSLDETRIVAVLLDVHMPVLGGTNAIREILGIAPSVRIISITARADEHDMAALRAAGASAVLIKPFALTDVLTSLSAT